MAATRISVWFDDTERGVWIVSLDTLYENGDVASTHTLKMFDRLGDAMEWAGIEGERRGLEVTR